MPAPTKGTIVPLEDKEPKRCRKWRVRKRTGKNPATGRYGERNRIVHGTYSDAVGELERLNAEVAKGLGIGKGRRSPTVEEACTEFYEARMAAGDVTPKTLETDRSARMAYCPHIGKIACSKLTPEMVDSATAAIIEGGSAKSTVRGYFAKMRMALDYAVDEGWAASNPFRKAAMPKKDTKERVAPTEAQVVSLARAMTPDDPFHAGVALGMMAGLRVGEAVSVARGDVSLLDDSMHVRGTKSASSDAVIPICGDLARFLAEYMAWQDARLEELGLSATDATPIVSDELGRPIPKSRMQTWWRRHRAELGLAGARFHDLRHGWANVLMRRNLPTRVISALMRHSSEQVTEAVYLHPDLDYMRGPLSTVSILGDGAGVPE